jgi:hypothetical protein
MDKINPVKTRVAILFIGLSFESSEKLRSLDYRDSKKDYTDFFIFTVF